VKKTFVILGFASFLTGNICFAQVCRYQSDTSAPEIIEMKIDGQLSAGNRASFGRAVSVQISEPGAIDLDKCIVIPKVEGFKSLDVTNGNGLHSEGK